MVIVKASRSRESHSQFISQKPTNRKALEGFFVVFLLHSMPYFIFLEEGTLLDPDNESNIFALHCL